jgi:hypothetical protein
MAALAQPTILKGLSALPPSRPRSHHVGISGPRPNNAIKPAVSMTLWFQGRVRLVRLVSLDAVVQIPKL